MQRSPRYYGITDVGFAIYWFGFYQFNARNWGAPVQFYLHWYRHKLFTYLLNWINIRFSLRKKIHSYFDDGTQYEIDIANKEKWDCEGVVTAVFN